MAKEIFLHKGRRPNLAIMIFGNDHKYYKNIKALEKEANRCGIDINLYVCEHDSSQMAAEGALEFLNNDDAIDAVYVQCPVPESVNYENLISFIDAKKDLGLEEDFENVDWPLFEARVFESVWERFKEA